MDRFHIEWVWDGMRIYVTVGPNPHNGSYGENVIVLKLSKRP